MKSIRKKNSEMIRFMRMLAILLVPMVALILGISAPAVWADNDDDDDGELSSKRSSSTSI